MKCIVYTFYRSFTKNSNLCPCGQDLGELSARLSGCVSGWGQCHLGGRSGKILLRQAAYPPQLHEALPVGGRRGSSVWSFTSVWSFNITYQEVIEGYQDQKAIKETWFGLPWLLAPPCGRSLLGSDAPGLAGWWSHWPVGHPHQNWTT